jgi:hypothetical protein
VLRRGKNQRATNQSGRMDGWGDNSGAFNERSPETLHMSNKKTYGVGGNQGANGKIRSGPKVGGSGNGFDLVSYRPVSSSSSYSRNTGQQGSAHANDQRRIKGSMLHVVYNLDYTPYSI